jgi:chemotaxis protein MotA
VFASVLGGYTAMGGKILVLMQPFEAVIIIGAALGSFIIGNPKWLIMRAAKSFGQAMKGSPYKKEHYIELLSLLYQVFKLAKSKGMLTLEPHVEAPDQSELFAAFPHFHGNHHAVTFVCDYLRMISLGTENAYELEALMDEEIETHHHEHSQVASAIQTMADGMPALGIVAAVLGVVKAMGAIDQSPEILGHLIASALVGTFAGIFFSYAVVGPLATKVKIIRDKKMRSYVIVKQSLLAFMNGAMPQVAIEHGRKAISAYERPTINEVESATMGGGVDRRVGNADRRAA